MGTPAYMAPEQTRRRAGRHARGRVRLGAVLYELAAGRPPIDVGGRPVERAPHPRRVPAAASRVARRHRRRAPRGPARAALVADLDIVLGKALRSARRRYASRRRLSEPAGGCWPATPIAARAPTWATAPPASRAQPRQRRGGPRRARGLGAAWSCCQRPARGTVQTGAGEDQFTTQVEVNHFITDDLFALSSPELGGPDLTARELLDRASARIERALPGPAARGRPRSTTRSARLRAARRLRRGGATISTRAGCGRCRGRRRLDRHGAHRDRARQPARSPRALREAEAALVPALARARLILGPTTRLYAALNDSGRRAARSSAVEAPSTCSARRWRPPRLPPRPPRRSQAVTRSTTSPGARARRAHARSSLALIGGGLRSRARPTTPRMTAARPENNIGATLQDLGRDAEAEPHLRARRCRERAARAEASRHAHDRVQLPRLQADSGGPTRRSRPSRVVAGQTALPRPQRRKTR
jgi:serine/threonine protein kinase